MCGIFNDVFDFVKDSVGEIFKHPGEALGAAFGVPGFDPLIGGLFNPEHSLLSPTGNFSSSAWQDMYNDHPDDLGGLNLFHGINSVADKVAPAAAGYFAAPAMAGALGGAGGDAATGLGGATFTSGLGDASASSLGGLEGGLGGAAMFGPAAGTGTALGAAAEGLGAGGLGIAGPSALGGLTAGAGTYAGGLGGGTSGTGLGGFSGGAQVPVSSTAPVGGGANSLEGSQALANGASGTQPGMPPEAAGGNLSTMYGPESTAAGSPTGSTILGNTGGVGGAVQNGALGAGGTGAGAGMNVNDLQSLFNLAKSGYGAYQQWNQGQKADDYMNSIRGMFSPTSPYAQQMQQTLARSDAAAGRNSQYGTRSVQLAAALAQAQANAMGNNNYAQAAQSGAKGNMLNSLFSNFSNPGQIGQLYNLGTAGFNGLASLFG